MTFQLITVEHPQTGIALITLNRPERRNALSIQMREEMYQALLEQREDSSVRVIIFTGAGPAFSSGFDRREFGKPELYEALIASSSQFYRELWHFPKPVISAIDGATFAGGLDIAVFSDLRICTEGAFFGHPQVKFGGAPMYTPLRWLVGQTMARSMCLRGQIIDAEEALRVGLVNEVVPPEQHVTRSIEIAEEIMEAPPEYIAYAKAHMSRSNGVSFDTAFYIEHDARFRRRMDELTHESDGD